MFTEFKKVLHLHQQYSPRLSSKELRTRASLLLFIGFSREINTPSMPLLNCSESTLRRFFHLNIVAPGNSFSIKLQELLTKYPSVDPNALGMKPDWQNEPLWK